MSCERFPGHESAEELMEETREHRVINRGGTRKKKIATKKEAIAAVKLRSFALEDVPKKFMTAELCRMAVDKNGLALRCVPENLKTEELCLEAVRQNGCVLEYVPEGFKTAPSAISP